MAIGYLNKGGAGVTSEDCTATKDKVLSGETYLGADTNDEVGTGTIPKLSSKIWTPGKTDQKITAKQYLDGDQIIKSLGGNVPANMVHPSYTFSSNQAGREVKGTMALEHAKSVTPSTSTVTAVASGRYVDGNVTIPGFSLPPANAIKKGYTYTLYGKSITGTYSGPVPEIYYIWTGSVWGLQNPGMTLTWSDTGGGKVPYSAGKTKPSIDRYYNYSSNQYTAGGCAKINTAIDLTPYKYLKFERTQSGTFSIPVFVGVSQNGNLQGNTYAAQFTGKVSSGVHSIDISKLSGSYYIYLGFAPYTASYEPFEHEFAPDRIYLTTA